MRTDDLNLAVIEHLRDGKKSLKKIAKELGVSENTIRTRVNKLLEKDTLRISGLVDFEKLPGHTTAIVGIKLQTMNLIKKGEEFSKLKGVVSVSVVTGRFDLILIILLNEEFGLLEFYTQEVAKIKQVESAETFVVYKAYNLRLPYVL